MADPVPSGRLNESSRILRDDIDSKMQKNIIDIKSQKLKQHQISLSSRNDLLLRENESKPGITPLKHFNFTF